MKPLPSYVDTQHHMALVEVEKRRDFAFFRQMLTVLEKKNSIARTIDFQRFLSIYSNVSFHLIQNNQTMKSTLKYEVTFQWCLP